MSRRSLIILVAALVVGMLCIARTEPNPFARQASRGFQLIDQFALVQPSDEELFSGAVRGMVDVLRERGDEHSAYIEPQQAEPLLSEMRQEFGGIGVRIQLLGEPPRLTIIEPPQPGTPAFQSEIRKGDIVLAVDNESIEGLSLNDVLSLMRGSPGDPILLSILHEEAETPVDVRLTRKVIQVASVQGDRRLADGEWAYRLETDNRIALVRIITFGNRTTEELSSTLQKLSEEKIEAIVLDVRDNAGGALLAAVGVSGLFLPAETMILSTRGRDGDVLDVYSTYSDGKYTTLPVAVLIDRNTASASEIVAAALQDHQVATIFGERSYGKGTVQQLLPISADNGLLKLTSASYWRPSGANIHRMPGVGENEPWGVSPDQGFEVKQTDEEYLQWVQWRRSRDLYTNPASEPEEITLDRSLENDPTLAKAVEYLQSQLAK